eukprot:CAMPEP_0195539396 /NCGR_PEP_ID=MMETSP0794_2-20130614/50030_1 /TAXON_ID=515487 /ORGANISM="Stephanopyxis turris, Strain CCMP 815" /LENGTH=55 /DNA_ID=CAMNT_0040673421 /DNA_START=604 /DNA_END=771 /DNA_ORIENTATION=+
MSRPYTELRLVDKILSIKNFPRRVPHQKPKELEDRKKKERETVERMENCWTLDTV